MEQFANEPSATLSGAINSSVTSITVSSPVNIPATGTFRAIVDGEYLKVTGVSGSTWTVVRGDGGSTAASHSGGATVTVIITAEALDALVSVQQAGTEVSNRRVLNFTGATVTDDATDGRCNIAIASGGGETGTSASRPTASGNSGLIYLPSDGMTVDVSDGTAWHSFGPVCPLVPPVLSNFTWSNQGTATATQTGNTIYLADPSGTPDNCRLLLQAAPATPYNLTFAILANWNLANSGNKVAGACFYDSTTGKLMTWGLIQASGAAATAGLNFNSATSFSGNFARNAVAAEPLWWRLRDDGTDLYFYTSRDGQNFILNFSVGRHAFLTAGPDKVGFLIDPNGGSGMTLLSWSVA